MGGTAGQFKSILENEEGRREVTLADVAREAGVSTSTASRVVRNRDLVHPETARKVLKAMRELSYSVDRNSPRGGISVVPVTLPYLSDPFFAMILKGIADAARLAETSVAYLDADYSEQTQLDSIRFFSTGGADSAIVVPVTSDPAFAQLIESVIPNPVYVDRTPFGQSVTAVVSDDAEGAYQATKYLLSLGHKRILYVGGEPNLTTEHNRLAGYKRALTEADLPIREELVHEHHFDQALLQRDHPESYLQRTDCTAVFAASDTIAGFVARELRDAGKRIPQDVSVIGYGDMPYSEHIGLTTVSSPSYEMGKNAFLLYQASIERKTLGRKAVVLRPSMVLRSSCGPPPS